MSKATEDPQALRRFRNVHLYRSVARILREYNRRLVAGLHQRGFTDFTPAFPQILSNLDTEGSRIGAIAQRAGVTRQAAGQLVAEIEACGYIERRAEPDDARATLVVFTPRGRRLLAAVFEILTTLDEEFGARLGKRAYERLRDDLFTIAESFDPRGALDPR
jgi:DNA-binding MarR family transcriptional regulator